MKNARKTTQRAYVYYFDWAEALLEMPADIRLKIDDAIKRYALYGEEPDDPAVKYSIFALIRPTLDRNSTEYSERCERVRKARSEAGRRGNEKRWGMSENRKTSQTSQTSLDSDSDSDSDSENIEIPPISKEIFPPTEQGGGASVKKRGYEAKKFKRPTLDEVREYIAEQGYSVDAEAFIDFYEAKGWRVGSNQMKDWRAAVRTWERRHKEERQANPQKTTAATDGVRLGTGEWIDETGRRTYGTGKATIPNDAPPRPGDKYFWNASTKQWAIM